VTLLKRTARYVQLTGAGAELLPGVLDTLAAADRLARHARVAARTDAGAVRVAFIWSTLAAYLAPLVAAAAERHPQIELAVRQLRFVEIAHALRRGEVDLVVMRGFRPAPEFVAAELNQEPSVVAIPAGHPLSGGAGAAAGPIQIGELRDQPLIVLDRELIPTAFDAEAGRLNDAGIIPPSWHPVRSVSEGLARVAAGRGIYYRLAASAALAQSGVVYRELDGLPMRTWLVRRAEPPRAALTAIEQLAQRLFSDASSASKDASAMLDPRAAAP
jgi:DNA-binding transcriptional LysR family regulator